MNKILTFLSGILITTLLLGQLSSCSDDNSENYACTLEVISDTLYFRIVDQSSGKDLFFSPDAKYQTKQLSLQKSDGNQLRKLNYIISDDEGEERYFITAFPPLPEKDTIFMQVADLSPDTLSFAVNKEPDSFCPRYLISKLKFNDDNNRLDSAGVVIEFLK